jgi:Flp pilus assembly pilin Flp
MDEIRFWTLWLQAHWDSASRAERDERGFTAVEWLMVALGVIAIAGIAVAAVRTYVVGQTNKLGSP